VRALIRIGVIDPSYGLKPGRRIVPQGRVKWFSDEKGFGFIEQDDGPDVFVHHSSITMEGFRTIAEGQAVEFDLEQSDRGPRATNVRVV
jgi:cold shock protein